jgi:tetratricopeptide (TPR) repeat protein
MMDQVWHAGDAKTLEYDLFVSLADKDKETMDDLLVKKLKARDLQVNQVVLDDDFQQQIEQGLARARFGVVVLSPSFVEHWSRKDPSTLGDLESVLASERILPIRHHLSPLQVARLWPLLTNHASVSTADGIDQVVEVIAIASVVSGVSPKLLKQRSAEKSQCASDPADVVDRQTDVGLVLKYLGQLEEARKLLESTRNGLGANDPSMAMVQVNLAMVLNELGNPQGALQLLEPCLESALKSVGDDDPLVASRRSNLALVLMDLEKPEEALDLLQKALASDLKSFGESHPSVIRDRSNLGAVLRQLGKLDEARDELEGALELVLKDRGEKDLSIPALRFNLARVDEEREAWEDAEKRYRSVLDAYQEALGPSHMLVAYTKARLARVLKQQARIFAASLPPMARYRTKIEKAINDI